MGGPCRHADSLTRSDCPEEGAVEEGVLYAMPFAPFDVTVRHDVHRSCWLATDNGLAAAAWLGTYGQWPKNHQATLGAIGVISGIDDDFLTRGFTADDAASRLVAGLLYLRAQISSTQPRPFHDISPLHL